MKNGQGQPSFGKKLGIAVAGLLCSALIGHLIGFGIVLMDPTEKDASESTYTVADNGYSGNSLQMPLLPLQTADSMVEANRTAQSSVVTIVTMMQSDSLWDVVPETSAALGSGVIVEMGESEIYVVTNAHVIADAEEISLYFAGEEPVPASLKGEDSQSDLAVIAIDRAQIPEAILSGLSAAVWADSDQVRVGDLSIAIGCPYGTEFGNTVTVGVIGGTEREITYDGITLTVMQTDAAINPGNSGGALVNEKGELIGINTAKVQMESVEGIGFAIPSNTAKPIVDQLIHEGSIERVTLGIAYYDFINEAIADAYGVPTGIVVYDLEPGSEGDRAGLREGDIITEIDGEELTSLKDLGEILDRHSVGDTVALTVIRGRNTEEPLTLSLRLAGENEEREEADFWGNARS